MFEGLDLIASTLVRSPFILYIDHLNPVECSSQGTCDLQPTTQCPTAAGSFCRDG